MKKKIKIEINDDLRPEYDFRTMKVVARGIGRIKRNGKFIELAPDVAEIFPTTEAVNEALRFLHRTMKRPLSKSRLV